MKATALTLLALLGFSTTPQDDKKRIEELEKKVAALEKRIAQLEKIISHAVEKENVGACEHLIDMLTQALKNYELDNNAYPGAGNASMVKALGTLGPKKLPYFEFTKDSRNDKGEVLDPWGRPLVYRNNAVDYPKNMEDKSAHNKTSFDMYSFGPDGKDDKGAGDDINNWD